MDDDKTIFVTGAGGFVGGRIVELLHLCSAIRVRAGLRRWSNAARLGRFPIDMVLCDVLDQQQVERALSGSTSVIHCAVGSRDVIVDGTHNILHAALKLGIERVVYISSAEVYGTTRGSVNEACPLRPTGSDYAESKAAAEELCWQFYSQGLPVCILRPSIVYGPFSEVWTVRLAERLQSGKWGVFAGQGDGLCNLVYVDDLVSAILLAEHIPEAIGEAFNIVGPEVLTWNEYFQRFNGALGLPDLREIFPTSSRLHSVSAGAVRSLGTYLTKHYHGPIVQLSRRFDMVKAVLGKAKKSVRTTPTADELSLYNRSAHYVGIKAEKILGYLPRYSIDAGLDITVQWLRHHGLISRAS